MLKELVSQSIHIEFYLLFISDTILRQMLIFKSQFPKSSQFKKQARNNFQFNLIKNFGYCDSFEISSKIYKRCGYRQILKVQRKNNMTMNLAQRLLVITLLVNLYNAQTCINPKKLSTNNDCTLYFSQECALRYCTYKTCFNQTTQNNCQLTQLQTSTNLAFCRNSCNYVTYIQSTGSNLLAIIAVISGIFTVILICTCIARRCCKNEERYQNQLPMRPASAEENQIQSDRRLSYWNYLDYQLKWQKIDANNSQWISQEQTCVICLQKDLHCRLPCRHYYHKNCIKEWLKQRNTCPTCKSQDFHQVYLRCKVCKIMKMDCFVQQLKKMQIQDKCSNCQ